jgi:hypothetical protein
MKHRIALINLPLLAVFLVLASTAALASNIWYVDGVHGSDNNNCKSRQHACKTIGHGIALASSGDSIMVAAATYTENLTIGFSLKIVGSGAQATIVDGGQVGRVVTIPGASGHVTLSMLTIRNGATEDPAGGGGVYNQGTLTIKNSTITGNTADPICTDRCGASGGGIENAAGATLTISGSTISGNSSSTAYRCQSCAARGGGISGVR